MQARPRESTGARSRVAPRWPVIARTLAQEHPARTAADRLHCSCGRAAARGPQGSVPAERAGHACASAILSGTAYIHGGGSTRASREWAEEEN